VDSSTLRITLSLLAYDYSAGALGGFAGGIMRAVESLMMLGNMLSGLDPAAQILLGTTLAAGAAFVLLAGGLGLAVTAGAQLQQAGVMASIAISDGSQHVGELEAAIVKLANTSQYKIADIDMAFRVLGGLGFTTGQILGGLGQEVIVLAQAMGGPGAGVSAADAAQLLGQAIYLFGQRGLTTKQAADELTGAFYSNMMSVSDLTQFLGMAGGTSASLGVSFGQLLTFGSMLTPMFGSASSAGASLSYMMRNLAHPATSAMADMIEKLKLHVYDAKGNFVGLKSIMDQLFADTKNMTEQQKMDVFGTLFNVRSGRAAMDLMSETQAQFDATYNRVNARIMQQGQAQKDSDTINNNTVGTWHRLTTTLNDFFAKAGEGIGTALIPLMNGVNNLLSAMQSNPGLMRFIGAFLLFGTIITGLITIVGGIILVFHLFGAVLAAALSPVLLVVAGIAALVAILIFAWTHWTAFRQVVQGAMHALGQFAAEIGQRLGPALHNVERLLSWLQQQWNAHWTQIAAFLAPIWHTVEGYIQVAWSIITGIFKIALDIIGGNWKQAWNDLKNMLGGIWSGIVNAVKNGIGPMILAVLSIGPKLIGFFGDLAGKAIGWGAELIGNLAKGIIQAIPNALGNAMSGIGGFIHDHLPHSPAKMGPLRDLEAWGGNVTKMLAVGMLGQRGAISAAFYSLFSAPGTGQLAFSSPLTTPSVAQAQGSAGSGQNQPITVQLTFDDKVLAEAFFTYTNGQLRQNGYTRINR
jgi:TP901 family phage tail tape measure protein